MATHCPQNKQTLWGAQQQLWRSAPEYWAPKPLHREMGPMRCLGQTAEQHSGLWDWLGLELALSWERLA